MPLFRLLSVSWSVVPCELRKLARCRFTGVIARHAPLLFDLLNISIIIVVYFKISANTNGGRGQHSPLYCSGWFSPFNTPSNNIHFCAILSWFLIYNIYSSHSFLSLISFHHCCTHLLDKVFKNTPPTEGSHYRTRPSVRRSG